MPDLIAADYAQFLADLKTRIRTAQVKAALAVNREQDGPTIGLLLCKSRNRLVVEYALRDAGQPLGVADYTHSGALPAPEAWEELLAPEAENAA